jgi:hypothetical protein
MLAIDGPLHVVANLDRGALGHRPAIGIGQGELALTARRDLLHKPAVSLPALVASLDLLLQLCTGRLMGTGFLTIGGIQITQGLRHLLVYILESLRKLGLGQVFVFAVDGLEFTTINGQEFCPKERQRLA